MPDTYALALKRAQALTDAHEALCTYQVLCRLARPLQARRHALAVLGEACIAAAEAGDALRAELHG